MRRVCPGYVQSLRLDQPKSISSTAVSWPSLVSPRLASTTALHGCPACNCRISAGSARIFAPFVLHASEAVRTGLGSPSRECGSRAGHRSAQLPGGIGRSVSAFASHACMRVGRSLSGHASPLLAPPASIVTSVTAVRLRARSTRGSMPLLWVVVSMLAAAPPPECDALSWRQ